MTNIVKRNNNPTLEDVVSEIGPLPSEAILLGIVEEDNLPLLFDTSLWSGIVSPNILIWNGETDFLKLVAEYILNRDDNEKDEMEFVVFTRNVEEWEFLANKTNRVKNSPCIGVIPFWSDLADQVLLALTSWIHAGHHPNHSIVVLVEGLENVLNLDFETKQNFNYILLRGGKQRVFAIGTVTDKETLHGLEKMFQTKFNYNSKTDRYEFLENDKTLEVWIPKTEI